MVYKGTCVEIVRRSNGKVFGYVIKLEDGRSFDMLVKDLKVKMYRKELVVDNLTLGNDMKLYTKKKVGRGRKAVMNDLFKYCANRIEQEVKNEGMIDISKGRIIGRFPSMGGSGNNYVDPKIVVWFGDSGELLGEVTDSYGKMSRVEIKGTKDLESLLNMFK